MLTCNEFIFNELINIFKFSQFYICNMVNINKYNSHKQKLFGIPVNI